MADEQAETKEKPLATTPGSDTSAPNPPSLSTEAQTKAETEPDKESPSTLESPTTPTDQNDHDKTSPAFFIESDPEVVHPDIDMKDRNNLVRLLALCQTGWVLGRGRGPRDRETCLWCRGPVPENAEMLTHVGNSDSCRNSWPATCLLDWINQELGASRHHMLRCPMCREEFFNSHSPFCVDFRVNQGGPDAQRVVDAAWVRCILFSPTYAINHCVKKEKPLILMESKEARKLVLLNRELSIFNGCEELPPVESDAPKSWIDRVLATHHSSLLIPVPEIPAQGQGPPGLNPQPGERQEEPTKPKFDIVWALLDWGNNEFRMSPFLSSQARVLDEMTKEKGGVVRTMNADEFNVLARENGGLKTAVTSFRRDKAELAEMEESGKAWLVKMVGGGVKEPEPASDKEWYERIARHYRVNLYEGTDSDGNDHTETQGHPSGIYADADDEWEDSAEDSMPELPFL